MVITFQFTNEYYDKAELLRKSLVTHNQFDVAFSLIEHPENIPSYRKEWPKNRDKYVSLQQGDFAHWLIRDPAGTICIQLDADTIQQRAISKTELRMIETRLKKFDILSVYGAYPPTPLVRVIANIGYPSLDASYFGGDWHGFPEFTASIMIATKETFQKLSEEYNKHFDEMTKIIPHHAGGQWLINWICYTQLKVGILPKTFQCGAWYDGCTEEDAQNAIFNHTK